VQYILEQQFLMYDPYMKNNFHKLCKRRFFISILPFAFWVGTSRLRTICIGAVLV
jgi:hypothetical protein